MGKLIRNGIEYGGGNGTDIFEVTQAEYDALVQAGTLVHNALYVITDAPNLNETAKDISYNGGVGSTYDEVEKVKAVEYTYTGTTTAQALLVSDIDYSISIRNAYITDSNNNKMWCALRPSATNKVVAMVFDDNMVTQPNKSNLTLHLFKSAL